MTDNERAEAAEQARLDEWEADREETRRDRISQAIAQDYARHMSVESAERRADFYIGLAKGTEDAELKRFYLTVASHFLSAAYQVKNTRIVDEAQSEMPFTNEAAA